MAEGCSLPGLCATLAHPNRYVMVRIGLTIYLVIATVAGSCFCCCVPGQLARLLAFDCNQSKEVATAPQRPSCCHPERSSAPDPSGSPMRDEGEPTCPCKQRGSDTAFSPDAEQLNHVLPRNNFAEPASFAFFTSLTCLQLVRQDLSGVGRGVALPYLSAHDLLTTLHILRC